MLQKLLTTRPLITVKEARKILGQDAKSMTDQDIRRLVESYDEIAKLIIRDHSVLKTNTK